jgi:hypothetical protein
MEYQANAAQEATEQEQQVQEAPKDENSQQLTLPQQVAPRYTPQFVKYANENVIRIDHFILDAEGNLTKWCAIYVENKETGELIHCIN